LSDQRTVRLARERAAGGTWQTTFTLWPRPEVGEDDLTLVVKSSRRLTVDTHSAYTFDMLFDLARAADPEARIERCS
jgi:hypothetical protein